jgi:hypothetical protein
VNTLTALLRDLARGGFRVRVEGGSIHVAPAEKVTPDLKARLLAHKPDLLEMGVFHGGIIPVEMWKDVLDWRPRPEQERKTGAAF